MNLEECKAFIIKQVNYMDSSDLGFLKQISLFFKKYMKGKRRD